MAYTHAQGQQTASPFGEPLFDIRICAQQNSRKLVLRGCYAIDNVRACVYTTIIERAEVGTMATEMQAIRFTDRALAISFADRCHKMHVVMLGDDERYWVVNMADAARLERAGYEFAY